MINIYCSIKVYIFILTCLVTKYRIEIVSKSRKVTSKHHYVQAPTDARDLGLSRGYKCNAIAIRDRISLASTVSIRGLYKPRGISPTFVEGTLTTQRTPGLTYFKHTCFPALGIELSAKLLVLGFIAPLIF